MKENDNLERYLSNPAQEVYSFKCPEADFREILMENTVAIYGEGDDACGIDIDFKHSWAREHLYARAMLTYFPNDPEHTKLELSFRYPDAPEDSNEDEDYEPLPLYKEPFRMDESNRTYLESLIEKYKWDAPAGNGWYI